MTFQCSDCFKGTPVLSCQKLPKKFGQYTPLYTANSQGCGHCSRDILSKDKELRLACKIIWGMEVVHIFGLLTGNHCCRVHLVQGEGHTFAVELGHLGSLQAVNGDGSPVRFQLRSI